MICNEVLMCELEVKRELSKLSLCTDYYPASTYLARPPSTILGPVPVRVPVPPMLAE